MDRTLKVFVEGDAREELREKHDFLEEYDAFVLLKAAPAAASKLARAYPLEDISDQFAIVMEAKEIATPSRFGKSGVAARAKQGKKAPDKKRHHYLVQFVGPIKRQWLSAIRKVKGEVRKPYEGFTYVVRADAPTMERIRVLPFVRWVGHLPHEQRIERNLSAVHGASAGTLPRTRVLPGTYVVEFFGPDDAARARTPARKLGFDVLSAEPKAELLIVRHDGSVAAQKKAVERLAAVHGVRMIRERTLDRPSNNVAAGLMRCAKSTANPGLKLDGTGETIAVCDTGLDTGDAANIHPDFAGRIGLIKSYPITPDLDTFIRNPGGNDGAADRNSGHGSHVAGSVLGDGTKSAGVAGLSAPVRGLAHKAKLVFQAVEQETQWKSAHDLNALGRYGLWGIPHDVSKLFNDAYNAGARIHSNSWGGGKPGEYDAQCAQFDRYVWDHKDFCILVAAGNDGSDAGGNGKINPMSVTSPGTSKNCITVGATENTRPEFNAERYGAWWPTDYPSAPFNNDPIANNANQVAAFSSRGPTADGRIKPDLVAPGTFILSTRSTQIAANNTAWAPFPASRFYFHMGGTSMATPLVAGAAGLVRQFLRTRAGIAKPPAALVKAMLIAGAKRLSGYSPTKAVCDSEQGFGRIDLDAVLSPTPASATAKLIEGVGLATGQVHTHIVKVKSKASALKVVLAYTDFPGDKLVNNLNLLITAPNGRIHGGNFTSTGALQFDTKNNVEVVRVATPATGDWTIKVIASNVPQGPQDYALVILGRLA